MGWTSYLEDCLEALEDAARWLRPYDTGTGPDSFATTSSSTARTPGDIKRIEERIVFVRLRLGDVKSEIERILDYVTDPRFPGEDLYAQIKNLAMLANQQALTIRTLQTENDNLRRLVSNREAHIAGVSEDLKRARQRARAEIDAERRGANSLADANRALADENLFLKSLPPSRSPKKSLRSRERKTR